jgi:hypothetical protein
MTMLFANNIFSSERPTLATDLVYAGTTNPSGCTFTWNDYYTVGAFRITWNSSTYSDVSQWRIGTGKESFGGASGSQTAPLYQAGVTRPYLTNITSGTSVVSRVEPLRADLSSAMMGLGVNLLTAYSVNRGSQDALGTSLSGSTTYSIGPCEKVSAVKTAAITAVGSGNFTVPADFVSLLAVDTVGGGGGASSAGTGSSGGGAWARIASMTTPLVAGVTQIPYVVGAGGLSDQNGGDTCWNATSLANAQSTGSANACAAEGGKTTASGTGGLGGSSANSVGTLKNSGGSGGSNVGFSNGGGGAAGHPHGVGGNGGQGSTATSRGTGGGGGAGGGNGGGPAATGNGASGGLGPFANNGATGAGGNGAAGTNDAGGAGSGNSGGDCGVGGPGVDWYDSTNLVHFGPGGGCGGQVGAGTAGLRGGTYGGGCGGRRGHFGAQGVIRFAYKTSASV